jgi:predicted ester cyclase
VVLTARSVPDQGGVVMMAAKLWGEGGVTTEHNKRLVHRALQEIYARGDLELANELVHPDFVDHEPAHSEQPTGPESVKQTVRSLQSAFGGLRFVVEDEIAQGDKVVQLVTMSGRHTGPLMGREPTGKGFAVRHIYIWRVADDKIVDHWGSRDDLGLLGQLGLIPVRGEPDAG